MKRNLSPLKLIAIFTLVQFYSCIKNKGTVENLSFENEKSNSNIASCSSIESTTNKSSNNNGNNNSEKQNEWGIHRVWVEDLGGSGISGCFPPAINCFDDIIVTSDRISIIIDDLDKNIANNTVRDFFHGNTWRELFPDLKGRPLGDLKSGKVTLVKNSNTKGELNYSVVFEGAKNPFDGPNYGN